MRNTFDWGLGTHIKLNQQWMLRANVKYEPTPTKNAYRDVNFPDGDKLGFQIGARYNINKQLMVDMLYGHVFVRQEPIGLTNPVTGVTTSGHVNTSINLIGAQLVWNI
jgi:long-chain fatty acid transport protein